VVTTAAAVVIGSLVPVAAQATTPTTSPTISAPTDGATVTATPLDVSATTVSDGTVGAIRFVLDGRSAYTVDVPVVAGVATGTLPVAGLDGTHSLKAIDCASLGAECNLGVTSTPVSITISLPPPTVASPAPGTVVGSSVSVTAGNLAASGVQFLVDGAVAATGTTATRSVSLAGLRDGTHQLRVRQCDATAAVCEGALSTAVAVVKDTRGPAWSSVHATPRTVYPAKDRYHDTSRLTARVGERAHAVRVVLRNHAGRVVRRWSRPAAGAGAVAVTFDGRSARGALLPNGRYRFTFTAKDVHGRASTSRAGTVSVSDKRLVATTVTRTVTAYDSGVQVVAGQCSNLYRLSRGGPGPYFAGGVGYYSDSVCHGTRQGSVATGVHALRLAPALRYGSVQVLAYGAAASRHGGPAFLYYLNPAGNLVAGRSVSRSLGWHAGRSTSLGRLVNQGALLWVFGTIDGHWYNVGSYRIRYVRFVLRSP
jgi:hypothetical protein